MDSSTDDSITSNEDVTPRMAESFDSYSQQDVVSDVNKDSQYVIQNTMYHYNNFDNSMTSYNGEQHDQEIYIYDNEQYNRYDKIDTSHSMFEHQSKRKKLNNGEAFDTTTSSGEKYIEENEVVDNPEVYANESKVPRKIQHMMEKMGYKPGKGLGKEDQGRVEPVEAVKQRGRRGFGHYVPGLKEASLKWDPAEEEIKVVEDIEWLQNMHSITPLTEDINSSHWIKYGPKKDTINDEIMFCNPNILRQVIDSKTIFDKLDKAEMRKARTRSNPYETIRCVNFLNRAAVKMANIDRACDFMFTNPKNVDPNELLYFADVCAGPGGFSEYILSRKKWHAKGFGFTLKNENDFSLDDFFAGPCETFHPFYGTKGNGDVFDAQNQKEFRSMVMGHTDGKGVHFMMSDGGFSVEGQENIQEILSKQLYLCQCLVALMIVRSGGHFVTKLFDLFTPFSVGLVYLMYHCFESISIFKPNTSRPANSERYLICKSKKKDTQVVMDYLSKINCLLSRRDNINDVIEIVSLDVLEEDTKFLRYLRNSNNTLGKKQVVNLLKIAAFCEDPTLIEPKQAEMRKECLKYWNLPDRTRVRPQVSKPQDKAQEILGNSIQLLKCEATSLKNDNVRNTILNQPYDWYCMPCSSAQDFEREKLATFYLGLGRKQVYRYIGGRWDIVGDNTATLELPSNTLVYAEIVIESKWTGTYFAKTRALHIIDAYMLGGEDVSKLYLSHRSNLTKKFCDALWKPVQNNYICVRAKERFLLTPDIHRKLRISVTDERIKLPIAFELAKNPLERNMNTINTTEYHEMNLKEPMQKPVYSEFNSVMFIRSIVKPWARHLSQKAGEFYVFNVLTKQSEYEIRNRLNNRPPDAEASFVQAFKERVIWSWPHDTTSDTLNMNTLVQMINQTLCPRST